jgi:lysophospholipase
MKIISSENYSRQMQETVEPFLSRYREQGTFERNSGEYIGCEKYRIPEARGVIIISHGFSECAVKYHEAAYYFLEMGLNVYIIDHRGHGRSFRMTADPSLVHVTDYRELISDFEYFAREIVSRENPELPLFVYAHSMGGAIAASALEDIPELFDRAVLSSPMLSINMGNVPEWFARAFTSLKIALGHGNDYFKGQGPFDGTRDFDHSTSAGQARYDYYFDRCLEDEAMQTWGSSYICSRELYRLSRHASQPERCAAVTTPVLLFSAGRDIAVTDAGQKRFISQVRKGIFVKVEGVDHEIFTAADEVIRPYWDKIEDFLR